MAIAAEGKRFEKGRVGGGRLGGLGRARSEEGGLGGSVLELHLY